MSSMMKAFLLLAVVVLPEESGCGSPSDSTGPDDIELVPTYVVVTPQSVTIKVGQTVDFSAEIQDQFRNTVQGSVQWSSANFNVAGVNAAGTATGRAAGISGIRAEYAGIRGVAQLTVTGGI